MIDDSSKEIARENYPSHWWADFPKAEAYDWEILPQEAGANEVIVSKRNELGLLSNFADTPFELDGVRYASLEGFWQMMKFPESEEDERCRDQSFDWKFGRDQVGQMLGFDAVAAGDYADTLMNQLGIDWVSYRGNRLPLWTDLKGEHYKLIVRATAAKLEQNPNVVEVLKKTHPLVLRPDHFQPEDAPPAWKYFEIYMEFRQKFLS